MHIINPYIAHDAHIHTDRALRSKNDMMDKNLRASGDRIAVSTERQTEEGKDVRASKRINGPEELAAI